MKSSNTVDTAIPEEFVRELRAILSEAETIMGGFQHKDGLRDFEELHARLSEAHKQIAAFYEQAKEKVAAEAKCADHAIRANPYLTIAAAFGIGLVIGVTSSRLSK